MILGVPILKHFRVYNFLQIADLQQEHQREMEGLLENVRQLSRELKLQMVIIDNFIPPEYQVGIISIFYGCMVWIEKSVTRVTDRHHEACRVMPNSDPE